MSGARAVGFGMRFSCLKCDSDDLVAQHGRHVCSDCCDEFMLVQCRACGTLHQLSFGVRELTEEARSLIDVAPFEGSERVS